MGRIIIGMIALTISAYITAQTEQMEQSPGEVVDTETSSPPEAEGNNAVRIYIDPETGEVTEPPADATGELSAPEEAAGENAAVPLETLSIEGGGTGVVLGDMFSTPVNVKTGCDGEVLQQGHDIEVSADDQNACERGTK